MSQSATVIIGEPCMGKSSVIRALLARDEWEFRQIKWLPHHYLRSRNAVVLGRYDEPGHQFPGTDRLSMAVQPHAQKFAMDHMGPLLLEGDRLGNASFLTYLLGLGYDLKVCLLEVDPEELASRRALERNQSEEFIRRQRTKTRNIAETFGHYLRYCKMDTRGDRDLLVDWLYTERLRSF